ncbi:hypothetical protein FEJ81_07680 [Natrinema versiforme]|uniref:Uncharacterized protein n=2 Tax=Natrinema versiforme TaxID=88724 RepID=A0A4V1G067_9EURY|nr:hypothetical protein [Natrinema versiforme]QCS44286.1 hypothetical protein FEJ81_07680 [Natrinema versiforme]
MALTFAGAIGAGLFVGGQIGLVSFVALLNFTAGTWLAQSIHSLGNARTDDPYNGIVTVLFDTTGEKTFHGFDAGRLGRLLALIAAVTAVSLLTAAEVLSGPAASIGAVAIGVVALVTAMVGFLIALGSSYDASERHVALDETDRAEPGPTTHTRGESHPTGGPTDGAESTDGR